MTAWAPGERFTRLHGESITAEVADNVLASMLINHDTNPDLVALAATIASEQGVTITFAEAAAILASEAGATFDDEGWMTGAPDVQ